MKVKTFWLVALLVAGLALGGVPVLADEAVGRPTRTPPAVTPTPQRMITFTGLVSSRPEGTNVGLWVIADRQVQATENTRFDETVGPAEIGVQVQVVAKAPPVATTASTLLEAVQIRVLPSTASNQHIIIRGNVTEIGVDHIVVNRFRIHFDRSTRIEGRLEVGAYVRVEAVRRADVGLHALVIQVLPDPNRVVEFEGVIERMGGSTWTIDGRCVVVDRRTTIIGTPEVGRWAKVRALRLAVTDAESNCDLLALTISVQNEVPVKVEWTGLIERLPAHIDAAATDTGHWMVGGREVWVTKLTEIVGAPRIGLPAHVEALQFDHRVPVAKKITVLEPVPVIPEPIPTATPTTALE